jgi:tetratricopeptide (TPR) repeat protein
MRSLTFPLRYGHCKGWIGRGLIVAGLVGLTAWRAARPEALVEAEAAYARSDLVTALRRACDRLDSWPPSPRAARVAALSLSRLDFADLAEPYYRRAGPLDLVDLHHRAYGLVRGNHRELAVHAYEEILARRPDDVLALRRQAAVLISQMRWNEALRLAERLTKIPEGEVLGYTLTGVVHHNLSEPELAAAAFERVLALDADLHSMPLRPTDEFWMYLGTDLVAIGRYADARRYLSRALTGTNNAMLLTLMGEAYYRDSMLEEAERCWLNASEWQPQLPMAWLLLGRLELTRGRPDQAIPLLERAARLAPEAYRPRYSLSLAHARLGHSAEAQRYRHEADLIKSKSAERPGAPGAPQLSP